MPLFSTGIILLLITLILIYLGFLHRVLDRLYLSSSQALLLIVVMIGSSMLPEIPLVGGLAINIGGGLIPLLLVLYILRKCSSKERWRSLTVILMVVLVVELTDFLLPVEPGLMGFDLDPLLLPGLVAGFGAYFLGRSRRAAFVGAVGGVIILDFFALGKNLILDATGIRLVVGGAGVFDLLVLAGVIATGLAEIIGEIRERLSRA